MSDWIELNLPYYKSAIFDSKKIKYPNLDKRAKKELGFNRKDIDELYEKIPKFSDAGYDKFEKAVSNLDKKLKKKIPHSREDAAKERAKKLLSSSNKDLVALGDYLLKRIELQDWENKQPEMIAYDKEFSKQSKEFHDNANKESFTGLGLNKPGTLIEVKYGDTLKQYLIGDINPICGVCDDCTEFNSREAIVVRYKVIWSNEAT